MPITTNKYIEQDIILWIIERNKAGEFPLPPRPVELCNFNKATDLETLEWALNEVGVRYTTSEVENRSVKTWLTIDYTDCELPFNEHGKYICNN